MPSPEWCLPVLKLTADICSGLLQYSPDVSEPGGGARPTLAYVDKPQKPLQQEQPLSRQAFNLQYELAGGVPKYDVISEAPLDDREPQYTADGIQCSSAIKFKRQSLRCFNCGSFLHSLKDCPEARDAAAISQARRDYQQGRLSLGNERYFEGAAGEYEDLKPGVLSAELRVALGGLRSTDPPPWLDRMQSLGYPPGYMVPGQEDGLVIIDDAAVTYTEGTPQPEVDLASSSSHAEERSAETSQLVAFPGVNAPIPEGADPVRWQRRAWHAPGQEGNPPLQKRMRIEPQHPSSMAAPAYLPQHTPGQHWPPAQMQHAYINSLPGIWTQQGFHSPAPAATGRQTEPASYHTPYPYTYSCHLWPGQPFSPAMGYPGFPVPTPGMGLPSQHSHMQQQLFWFFHYGTHMHPVHAEQAAGSPYFGTAPDTSPSTPVPGPMLQGHMTYPVSYVHDVSGAMDGSMLGSFSVAWAPDQPTADQPPLPPEPEIHDSSFVSAPPLPPEPEVEDTSSDLVPPPPPPDP